MYKSATHLIFVFSLLFVAGKVKEAKVMLQYEVFNEMVTVEVVDLPLCNKAGTIIVRYKGKDYSMGIGINDCINGKYMIGDKLEAEYNPKLDDMQPKYILSYGAWWLLLLFLLFAYAVWIYEGVYLTRKKTLQKKVVSQRINKPVKSKKRR
jgi:hypothetical protein